MENLHKAVYLLLFIVLSAVLLHYAKPFLVPVALAGILAMLFTGFCQKLEKKGVPRSLASTLAVLLMIAIAALACALLWWRIQDFYDNITQMKTRALTWIADLKIWIDAHLGISSERQNELFKQQAPSIQTAANMWINFANQTFSLLVDAILVMVYLFLLLYYRSRIKRFILKLVSPRKESEVTHMLEQAARSSRSYLVGLASMIALLWILYGIGFSIMGVENALFFAIICGILEIVPFVGNITGTSITVLSVIAQGGDIKQILGVVGVYLFIQFVQTYFLEPLVVGDQVNINPLFTIMALVLGELLWGIAGMVLAIPTLGLVKILCDHLPTLQPFGYLIGTDKRSRKQT